MVKPVDYWAAKKAETAAKQARDPHIITKEELQQKWKEREAKILKEKIEEVNALLSRSTSFPVTISAKVLGAHAGAVIVDLLGKAGYNVHFDHKESNYVID